ncbi:hypothetical protein G9F32_16420 [Acinetobacter sp. 194]|uniref:hypothetical protein n=1 Tax=Acinetobacter shaoyimingii TaxID=2715164 RepID=UPI00140AA810|nr:hypothetical protein [Acinetobacter shaoyimingii]NHB59580.1 hypothetical protein [Acinetobacter shaoyimingii]
MLGGDNHFQYAPNPIHWIDPWGLARRGRHGNLKNSSANGQSHHLNQDSAFRDVIPREDGAAIKLAGNAFCDIGVIIIMLTNPWRNFGINLEKKEVIDMVKYLLLVNIIRL